MSDEAIKAARRILAWDIGTVDISSWDRDSQAVARALLSREAERDAVIEECVKVIEATEFNGDAPLVQGANFCRDMIARRVYALKGQPSADGNRRVICPYKEEK